SWTCRTSAAIKNLSLPSLSVSGCAAPLPPLWLRCTLSALPRRRQSTGLALPCTGPDANPAPSGRDLSPQPPPLRGKRGGGARQETVPDVTQDHRPPPLPRGEGLGERSSQLRDASGPAGSGTNRTRGSGDRSSRLDNR